MEILHGEDGKSCYLVDVRVDGGGRTTSFVVVQLCRNAKKGEGNKQRNQRETIHAHNIQ